MRQNVFELILINGTFNAVTVIPSSNTPISARTEVIEKLKRKLFIILICCLVYPYTATLATLSFEERVNVILFYVHVKSISKFHYAKSRYNNIEQF